MSEACIYPQFLSESSLALIEAHDRGYRVDADGTTFKPNGERQGVHMLHGYERFTLKIGRRTRHIMIHRLQAYQKFGIQVFDAGIQCRHLDGNCRNNSDANIAIGTAQQNAMDKPLEVRKRSADIAQKAARLVTVKHDYAAIVEYHKKFNSYRITMQQFGITSKGTLNYILNHGSSLEAKI